MKKTPASPLNPEVHSAPEPALLTTATVRETTSAESTAPLVEPERAVVRASATPSRPPAARATRLRAVTLAGAAALVVAAIALPRLAPPVPGAAGANEPAQPGEPVAVAEIAPSTHAIAPPPIAPPQARVPSKKSPLATPAAHRVAEATKSTAPVAATASAGDAAESKDVAGKLPVSEPMGTMPPPAPVSTGSAMTSPVTITGCLEISTDEDTFRLTDTEGVDAPKSRGWRTGFLRKRPAAVALLEVPDRLALKTNIGKRVAATGVLTSHELKLNSLRVVGPSCN